MTVLDLVLLIVWLATAAWWRLDALAHREVVSKLLDRICAQTPGVIERLDTHEARRVAPEEQKERRPAWQALDEVAAAAVPYMNEDTLAEAKLDFESVLK